MTTLPLNPQALSLLVVLLGALTLALLAVVVMQARTIARKRELLADMTRAVLDEMREPRP